MAGFVSHESGDGVKDRAGARNEDEPLPPGPVYSADVDLEEINEDDIGYIKDIENIPQASSISTLSLMTPMAVIDSAPRASSTATLSLTTPRTVIDLDPRSSSKPTLSLMNSMTIIDIEPRALSSPTLSLMTPTTVIDIEPRVSFPPTLSLMTPTTIIDIEPRGSSVPVLSLMTPMTVVDVELRAPVVTLQLFGPVTVANTPPTSFATSDEPLPPPTSSVDLAITHEASTIVHGVGEFGRNINHNWGSINKRLRRSNRIPHVAGVEPMLPPKTSTVKLVTGWMNAISIALSLLALIWAFLNSLADRPVEGY